MRKRQRRFGGRVAFAALAAVLLVPSMATASGPAPVCNVTYCISEGLTPTSNPPGLIAAAPLTVDLSIDNTSSPLDRDHWTHTATVSVSEPGVTPLPTLTPSRQLPDGLLLAGGGSCSPPNYTDCPGGYGTVDVHTSPPDSDTTGAFGIAKIANMNPPAAGAYASYRVTIKSCIYSGGTCQQNATQTEVVKIPEEGGEPSADFTLSTDGAFSIFGFTVEYAIDSFTFHLDGQSNQLESGPAAQTYTILALPASCGVLAGTSTFTSRGAGSVSIPQSISVTGCPTAALGPHTSAGSIVELDGSGSSTSVEGRSIASWHWDFGDGASAVTTSPTVSHDYPTGGEYTVSLYVQDSAGARSPSVTQVVTASARAPTVPGAGDNRGAPNPSPQEPSPGLPDTKIERATINSGHARFEFVATGASSGFQCALVPGKQRKARFRSCRSPKTYNQLKPGRYAFEVRAIGSDGPDPSPAKKRFTVA